MLLACAAATRVWAADSPGQGTLSGFQFAGGYGADGYKTWDILGQKAQTTTDANAPVVISEMRLLMYAGGPSLAIETRIESSQATVATGQGIVQGSDKLYIYGANDSYRVTGNEWSWDGNKQIIHLGRSVYVNFTAAATASNKPAATPSEPVTILSDVLDIYQEPDENRFVFSGNVNVTNGESHTTCQQLEVLAQRSAAANPAAPAAERAAAPPVGLGVGHVEHIVATNQVVVSEGDLEASGQQAEMIPSEQRVVLSGSPQMRDNKSETILEGGHITWLRDRQEIQVEPTEDTPDAPGRVRVSLPPLNSYQPGAPAQGANDPDRLVITGESLRAQFGANQRRFDVEKSVHVEDPGLTVDADHLDAEFDPVAPASASAPEPATAEAMPQVGKLNHLAVNGNVTIRQTGLITTTPQAEILPAQNQILLSDGPHVVDTQSSAVMDGERITISLDGQSALVTGSVAHPTKLHLPTMPGLGGVLGPNVETTVASDQVKVLRYPDYSLFTFFGGVNATASDLELTCKTLDVYTNNAPPAAGADPLSPSAQFDKIQKLVARDQVDITQRDYHAHAARAEIYPRANLAGDATSDAATPYRSVQLFGDPTGVGGPVRPEVELPPMQGVSLSATPSGRLSATANTAPTIVTSDEQWLLSSPAGNTYYFDGNVHIDAGILRATCDKMSAIGASAPSADPAKPGKAPMTLDRILADGEVWIVQGTTISTAGHAEILPAEHIATLSDNAMVADSTRNMNLKDANIVIHLDTHRAEAVRPPPTPGATATRPTITLPAGAINFDKLMKPGDKPAAGSSP
jgi:lipopolysaccharide export system protein LptA